MFACGLLANLGFDTPEKRKELKLSKSPLLDDLRVLDMYELAIRRDVELMKDRAGNWVQAFVTEEDVLLFATSQFRRFAQAESFVKETLGAASDVGDLPPRPM